MKNALGSAMFCLQAVRAVLERRGSAVRTPKAPRKRSENVVQAPWNATSNSAERSENSVGTPWTQRGRHGLLFSQIKSFFLGVLVAFWKN